MSREIKFRGRDAEGVRGWVYGYLVYRNGMAWIVNELGDFKVIAGTEGQFTGLRDKNGKEIYESDIVRGDWHWDGWRPHVIEWPDDVYDLRESCLGGEDLEVLGNIYENPDLLEMK